MTRLKALLDAGVPDSVGNVLRKRGHDVLLHRNVLPEKTPDDAVAATALANGAILVAIDRDMKQIAQRYGTTSANGRFKRLSMIRLCCDETIASKRLDQALSLIEHEWAFTIEKSARRMWIDVATHFIRSYR